MKKFSLIIAFLFSTAAFAFMFPGTPENINAAIKVGNATELAKYFAPNIELVIENKSGPYSKAQAEMIVKDFFAKNQIKEFKVMHQNSSPDNSLYSIGSLITATKSYRTYYLLRKNGDSYAIHQLRFEEE